MEISIVMIFLIAALLAGLGAGWFLGSRPIAEWKARFEGRDGEARELDEKFRRAITELAAASVKSAQLDPLIQQSDEIRGERDSLATQLATASERASDADKAKAELALTRTEREEARRELAGLKADALNFAEQKRV